MHLPVTAGGDRGARRKRDAAAGLWLLGSAVTAFHQHTLMLHTSAAAAASAALALAVEDPNVFFTAREVAQMRAAVDLVGRSQQLGGALVNDATQSLGESLRSDASSGVNGPAGDVSRSSMLRSRVEYIRYMQAIDQAHALATDPELKKRLDAKRNECAERLLQLDPSDTRPSNAV